MVHVLYQLSIAPAGRMHGGWDLRPGRRHAVRLGFQSQGAFVCGQSGQLHPGAHGGGLWGAQVS